MKKIILIIFFLSISITFSQWFPINNSIKNTTGNDAFATDGKTLVGSNRNGITISSDNGASWKIISPPLWDVHTIEVNNENIFTATNTGIYKSSDNGDNWEKMNFEYTDVTSFAFDENDIYIGRGDVYEHTGGVYKSTDNGDSWEITGLKDIFIPSVGVKDGKIFAGTGIYGKHGDFRRDSGDVFISYDQGANWELTLEDQYIHKFDANDSLIFAAADYGGGVFFTADGKEWINKYGIIAFLQPPTSFISLAVDGEKVAASSASIWEDDGIIYSTNNGKEWREIGPHLPSTVFSVRALLISGDYLFAGIEQSWGTEGGVHLSTDEGESWEKKNDGLTCLRITSFAKNGEYIFVGTEGGGIFRAKISDLVTDVRDVETGLRPVSTFFPNPAHDYIITTQYIGWDYQIYNLLGNCVQSGSIDTDRINISSLPAGLYTIRFYKDGKQFVEKMMKEM